MAGDGAGNGAVADGGYRSPPQQIIDIVDSPPEPLLSFSPDRSMVRPLPALETWGAASQPRIPRFRTA